MPIVVKEQTELAVSMSGMCSNLEKIVRSSIQSFISDQQGRIAGFEAMILIEPYKSIYEANITSGATLQELKDAVVYVENTFKVYMETNFADIMDNIKPDAEVPFGG